MKATLHEEINDSNESERKYHEKVIGENCREMSAKKLNKIQSAK